MLFKTALAVVRSVFRTFTEGGGELRDMDDYETNQLLNNPPKECLEVDVLMPQLINSTHITTNELNKIQRKICEQHPELDVRRFAGGPHMHSAQESPLIEHTDSVEISHNDTHNTRDSDTDIAQDTESA